MGLWCTWLVGAGCGARSDPAPPFVGTPLHPSTITACFGDLDCGKPDLCAPVHCIQGTCVADPPVVCSDGDDCTEDRCNPKTGTCEYRRLTYDEDGDGHYAPRPGFAPGAPGACGDDCNDASALAYPGGVEKCDGVDNDCNGIVDDGAVYVPPPDKVVLLSTGDKQAVGGGIAFGANVFGVVYGAEHDDGWQTTFTAFDELINVAVPPLAETHVNTDSLAGPVVWNGAVFASAWEDRRDGDYEIYFNRFDQRGNKLGPDLRVTNAPGFSLRPDLLWDGAEFVTVWHDNRDDPDRGRIYGQRISADGSLIGDNVALTPLGTDADDVSIAQSESGFAIVFNERGDTVRQLVFRTLSPDLSKVGDRVVVGESGAASSALAWSLDRYVVVWDTRDVYPGPSILGATLAADGAVLLGERPVTAAAPFARSESIVPLGDRLLFAWAEDRDGSYDLYTKMLGTDLTDRSAPQKATNASSDSLFPGLALGGTAGAAMVFEDNRSGAFEVYAMRLACVIPPP